MRNLFQFVSIVFCITLPLEALSEPFRVGAILALSGPQASMGNYIRKGMEHALSSLPSDSSLELHFEDDQFVQTKAIAAYHSLITEKNAQAVIVLGSAMGIAISPLAERNRIPLIAVGASNEKVVQGKKFSFIHWIPPQSEAALMVPEVKRRKYARIGIVAAEQEGAEAVLRAFQAEMERAQEAEKIVLIERVSVAETDFRSVLTKARSEKIDALFALVFAGQLAPLTKQVRSSGLHVEIFGVETPEDEAEVRAADGGMEGVWYATGSSGTPEFIESYQKRFGELPGWAAANGYDTVKLLDEAVRAVGRDGEKIAEYLRNVRNFRGALGVYSTTGDNRFLLPAVLREIRNGKFQDLPKAQ